MAKRSGYAARAAFWIMELAAVILLCGAVAVLVHWFLDAAYWLVGLL